MRRSRDALYGYAAPLLPRGALRIQVQEPTARRRYSLRVVRFAGRVVRVAEGCVFAAARTHPTRVRVLLRDAQGANSTRKILVRKKSAMRIAMETTTTERVVERPTPSVPPVVMSPK